MWMLRVLDRKRIPPVLLFWVMVANLPPPVPRKTSSTSFMLFTGGGGLFIGREYGDESLIRHLSLKRVENVILSVCVKYGGWRFSG